MTEFQKTKTYDLEEKTFHFAKRVRNYAKRLSSSVAHFEDTKQLIRASGSVGANCIEANESLGKKDFLMRIKICRKEAKECRYWLSLIDPGLNEMEHKYLFGESIELTSIFGAIVRKVESGNHA